MNAGRARRRRGPPANELASTCTTVFISSSRFAGNPTKLPWPISEVGSSAAIATEAIETAIKVARKWGYRVKGVPRSRPRSSWPTNNFHGRTTTIVSFSTDPDARDDFGPYTPGFRIVPYGDLAALAERSTPNTVAVLLEPIQGEAGVLVPPAGYLAGVRGSAHEHERAVHRRRDPVRPRPHRADVRLRARGRRPRHVRAGQGARRRHRAGLRGRRRRATCSGC